MNKSKLSRLAATFIAAALLVIPSKAGAKDLMFEDVEAGTLESLVGPDVDVTSLTVKGFLDVRDLDFIGSKLNSLETLNIEDVHIRAYQGFRPLTQQSQFAMLELPKLCFAGSPMSEILLPESLQMISDGAFAGSGLTKIDIPVHVANIGDGAFADCSALTSVTVPETVKKIGTATFSRCEALKKVNYNAAMIPDEAFRGCTSLETVVTGTALEEIGARSFADCSALQTVSFSGSGLRYIGQEAFRGSGMKEVDFSKQGNFNLLAAWSLADMPSLQKVTLHNSVTTIGEAAFFNDSQFSDYTFSKSVTSLGTAAYKGTAINELYFLHEKLKEIPPYALYGMTELELLHLPGPLTNIGEHAMDGLASLQELSAPTIVLVPELGEDVWGSMDKSKVKLGVPEELIDAFKEADQWRDFDIIKAHIDPPDVALDVIEADDDNLNVYWSGFTMTVTADNPMEWVELYDMLGRQLYFSGNLKGATSVSIDTSRWADRFYIVRTPRASVKTIR